MRRQDYFRQESRGWLRLHEKGGKRHDVPAHHRAAEALDDYLEAAGPGEAKAAALPERRPGGSEADGAGADLLASTCCHTFRATGITAYLSNGGTLDRGSRTAGRLHPDPPGSAPPGLIPRLCLCYPPQRVGWRPHRRKPIFYQT